MSQNAKLPFLEEEHPQEKIPPKPKASTPMMTQYYSIKENYPNALLFYRMGDFYELFFEDAITASRELDITLTKRGKNNDEDIPLWGGPFPPYEGYLAKLIKKGYHVAICEQLEDPLEAKKRGAKGPLKRDVVRLVTPGTLTEETLLNAKVSNLIVCLSPIRNDTLSLAFLDLSTGSIAVEEMTPETLEEQLSFYNPSEIILPDSYWKQESFQGLLKIYQKKITNFPLARFDALNAKERLLKTYNVQTLEGFASFTQTDIKALGSLVDYVQICQKSGSILLRPLQKCSNSGVLQLDLATRRSLDLDDSRSSVKNASLFDVLDHTKTASGARLLRNRLAAPLASLEPLEERLDFVEFFTKNQTLLESCQDLLKQSHDLERALTRLYYKRGGPKDLKAILEFLKSTQSLKRVLPPSPFMPTLLDKSLK